MNSTLSGASSTLSTQISPKEPLILVLSGVKGDTRRYRIYHTFEQLNLAGVPCMLSHITEGDLLAKLQHASVVIFHRVVYDRFVEKLFHTIHNQGSLPIFDADDLTFKPEAFQWIDSPDFQDPIRAALYLENMRRTQQALSSCVAVMTSTEYLSEQARNLDKPTWVHRNAYSQEMLEISDRSFRTVEKPTDKLVIGYASGTATHNRDFESVTPVLLEILGHYPNIELWIIGPLKLSPGLAEFEDRVRHFPLISWRQLPDWLAQFSINLAPLVVDNPFAQSKSEIKYMEAALVHVPTVASPTEAFQYAIRSGENGFIARSPKEWAETLENLIINPDLRKDTGDQAYLDVLSRYHPVVRSMELVNTLNQIVQSAQINPLIQTLVPHASQLQIQADPPHKNFWRSNPEMEKQPSLARMAVYSLKYRSLVTMLMQVWIYFRRLIAPLIPYKISAKEKTTD
jgi:glycosyltransferase involved in cell wall biosynthesis